MYLYTFNPKVKARVKYYNHHKTWIENHDEISMLSNWTYTDYMVKYFALCKAIDLKFYSKEKVKVIPVYGYLVSSEHFHCQKVE